jgi:hypothetical protein
MQQPHTTLLFNKLKMKLVLKEGSLPTCAAAVVQKPHVRCTVLIVVRKGVARRMKGGQDKLNSYPLSRDGPDLIQDGQPPILLHLLECRRAHPQLRRPGHELVVLCLHHSTAQRGHSMSSGHGWVQHWHSLGHSYSQESAHDLPASQHGTAQHKLSAQLGEAVA